MNDINSKGLRSKKMSVKYVNRLSNQSHAKASSKGRVNSLETTTILKIQHHTK